MGLRTLLNDDLARVVQVVVVETLSLNVVVASFTGLVEVQLSWFIFLLVFLILVWLVLRGRWLLHLFWRLSIVLLSRFWRCILLLTRGLRGLPSEASYFVFSWV